MNKYETIRVSHSCTTSSLRLYSISYLIKSCNLFYIDSIQFNLNLVSFLCNPHIVPQVTKSIRQTALLYLLKYIIIAKPVELFTPV